MAAVAVRGVERVIVIDVARRAGRRGRRHVRARQRKARHAVIKRSRIPALRCVAVRAIAYRERRPCS
jgi:hypothetical protein